MKIKYLTKNGVRLDIRSHVGDKLKHFTVTQGSCYGNGHLFMAFERKEPHAIKIVKMAFPSLKLVKVSHTLHIGHANCMCYRKGKLYITHSAGERLIHRIDAETLTKDDDIPISIPYTLKGKKLNKKRMKAFNGICTYGSGYILRCMGGQYFLILNKRFKVIGCRKFGTKYETSQGMTMHNRRICRCFSSLQSSDHNFCAWFNTKGKRVKKRRVEVTGEVESIFTAGGNLYGTVYRKKKVDGKKVYKAYVFRIIT